MKAVRDMAGRFTGENGGRRVGQVNRTRSDKQALASATLEAVQATAGAAVRQLREKVSSGDMAAIRFVLEYSLPRGGRTIPLGSSDPSALLDAIADGIVSPDEAARLSQSFKTAIEASEVKELTRKIEELETLVLSMAR